MMLYDSKEDAIREEFFHTIRLSKTNREIAGKYLHMDDAEAPELLEKAEHQDLASDHPCHSHPVKKRKHDENTDQVLAHHLDPSKARNLLERFKSAFSAKDKSTIKRISGIV